MRKEICKEKYTYQKIIIQYKRVCKVSDIVGFDLSSLISTLV